MTDQENTPEGLAGLVQLWIVQLRRITERLAGMVGLGESALSRTVPALRGLPLPGALSAAQLDSIARRVAAQRSSIAAMQAQLAAFDEQLAVLEGILGPLTEWGKTWARFERLVLPARGDPAAEGSREPGPGGVIHFPTLTSVHSCGSADQRVYTDNPQDYPQDATLAGPGLA